MYYVRKFSLPIITVLKKRFSGLFICGCIFRHDLKMGYCVMDKRAFETIIVMHHGYERNPLSPSIVYVFFFFFCFLR